ncbi:MAG: hypothetical protein LBT18_05510 [Endomicrobium sp.]|jgi:hypothetical protein|nr:hypothetical protein [Endomicrobium sp.]
MSNIIRRKPKLSHRPHSIDFSKKASILNNAKNLRIEYDLKLDNIIDLEIQNLLSGIMKLTILNLVH